MVAHINTVAFQGVDVVGIDCQMQMAPGMPVFSVVGLPDKAVGESRERVRAALGAIGLALPTKRITVNLAPADLLKEGSHFDLPIALGVNDLMAIWFVQIAGPWVHFVKYIENSGEGLAFYAAELQKFQQETGCTYGDHYWPHDANARILDEKGRTRTAVMSDLGYQVQVVERGNINAGIEAVRNVLPKCRFDAAHTADGIKALKNYKKEWDDMHGTWKNKPLHNWASNGADAFRTGAMGAALEVSPPREGSQPRYTGGVHGWMG